MPACINRKYIISAGHRLMGLNKGHKCGQIHGHTYEIEVQLTAKELDDVGFVLDFAEVDRLMGPILTIYDHKLMLSKTDPLVKILEDAREPIMVMERNPTSEHLARDIGMHLSAAINRSLSLMRDDVRVIAVTVSETPRSSATVYFT